MNLIPENWTGQPKFGALKMVEADQVEASALPESFQATVHMLGDEQQSYESIWGTREATPGSAEKSGGKLRKSEVSEVPQNVLDQGDFGTPQDPESAAKPPLPTHHSESGFRLSKSELVQLEPPSLAKVDISDTSPELSQAGNGDRWDTFDRAAQIATAATRSAQSATDVARVSQQETLPDRNKGTLATNSTATFVPAPFMPVKEYRSVANLTALGERSTPPLPGPLKTDDSLSPASFGVAQIHSNEALTFGGKAADIIKSLSPDNAVHESAPTKPSGDQMALNVRLHDTDRRIDAFTKLPSDSVSIRHSDTTPEIVKPNQQLAGVAPIAAPDVAGLAALGKITTTHSVLEFLRDDAVATNVLSTQSQSLVPAHSSPSVSNTLTVQKLETLTVGIVQSDGSVEVTLKPEELGRVSLKLESTGNSAVVSIMVERLETQELVKRHLDLLERELQNLGFEHLAFTFDQGGHPDENTASQPGEGKQAEDTRDGLAGATYVVTHGQISGLDIRV